MIQNNGTEGVDDTVAELMMPMAMSWPQHSVVCLSLWLKKMSVSKEKADFMTILNQNGQEWLGVGIFYDTTIQQTILSLTGVLEMQGKGISDVIPVRRWHHICLEIDMANQVLAVAMTGNIVIEKRTFMNNKQPPTNIQVVDNVNI